MALKLLICNLGANLVSIPKRVSEVLWLYEFLERRENKNMFQSLKGFQRFCGPLTTLMLTSRPILVSIPKRVSEVLWPVAFCNSYITLLVSIPKRVSEVLWPPQQCGCV